MSHQVHYLRQTDALHYETAGEGMPQAVPRKISDSGFLYSLIEPMAAAL